MIDWQRVNELKEEIGEDDFAEVAELFIAEIEEAFDRLRGNPGPADLAGDLHFIKSSALNLGFSDLAALCQDGEHRASSGSADTVELAPILSCYTASKAAFQAG